MASTSHRTPAATGMPTQRAEASLNHSRIRALAPFTRNRGAISGAVVIVLFALVAITAPVIAPYDPTAQHPRSILEPPNSAHLLGTDSLGRDILSRIMYGGRISLSVGFSAVAVGLLVGATIGIAAGYFGRHIEDLIMRGVDVLMAIPGIILALTILAAIGPSFGGVVLAIAVSSLPTYARLARSQTLYIREMDYITAARALGAGPLRIMAKHVLPNIVAILIVSATTGLGSAILTEAGLSFLGLGVPPPTPTWGGMVSEGREFIFTAPYVALIPGVFIMLTVLAFNLTGDGLRDALDPRSNAHARA